MLLHRMHGILVSYKYYSQLVMLHTLIGAAQGAFLTYSIYMTRKNGVVRVGTLTPLCNNFVSLLCGILVFCCVFSVLVQDGYSDDRILEIIQENGPANTGLTFIWYI